jgi:Interferon-induced transmembrane protein.
MSEINQETYQSSNFNDYSQPAKPDNNLVLAIISTVVSLITCCGWVSCIGVILGIIAIVFSTQVDNKYSARDYAGAESASKTAKLLSLIAFGTVALSIIFIIISIVLQGGISGFMEQYQNTLEQYGGR